MQSHSHLTIFDQLDSDTLPDGGIGLLRLNSDLLQDDALCMRGAGERIGLPPGSQMRLFVVLIVPLLIPAVILQLTSRPDAMTLSHPRTSGGSRKDETGGRDEEEATGDVQTDATEAGNRRRPGTPSSARPSRTGDRC